MKKIEIKDIAKLTVGVFVAGEERARFTGKDRQEQAEKWERDWIEAAEAKPTTNQADIQYLARANGALVEAHRNRKGDLPEGMEMAAFMAVFHPNIQGEKLKALLK